jgi:hypothetical protein
VLDQVADSFYVKDPSGRKLDEEQQERLRADLLRAAGPEEAHGRP